MNKLLKISLIAVFFVISTSMSYSFSPKGKDLGVGLIVGDHSGVTLKLWDSKDVAYNFHVGNSYFGDLTLGADYMQHYNAFESNVFNLHLAAGAIVGTGKGGNWFREGNKGSWYYREDGGIGIAARAMIGVNFVPKNSPFEITFQIGPVLGITPKFGGFGYESDLSFRFYP